jgi:hypothetical protein
MARKKTTGDGKSAKSDSDKAATFSRLGTTRTNKALKSIRQIGYLANPTAYTYSTEQVQAIISALRRAVDDVEATFADPKAPKSEGFTV